MPKKASVSEFSMAEAVRECLHQDSKIKAADTLAAIETKYPRAKINKNSFSVAFYTIRNKLGLGKAKRRRKFAVRSSSETPVERPKIDVAMIQQTARFISQVGGTEAALEAIKFVQAAQIKQSN